MSLKSRIVALEKRRNASALDRIRSMTTEELDAAMQGIFQEMERTAEPVYAAHIRAAAKWFMTGQGINHPESERIMRAIHEGPLQDNDLEIINFNSDVEA